MPTQRPFLSNFLAAFRSYNSPKPQPSLTSSSAVAATSQTLWTSTTATPQKATATEVPIPSNPKPINSKTYAAAAASSASSSQDKLHHHSSLQHNVSPQTHLPRTPSSTLNGLPVYGPQNKPQPSYPTASESRRARRRGSDSSSDSGGFREGKGAAAGEKWFVGGRAPNGEEKYYKLSMVKRDRSSDRISADQLSL